MPVAVSRRRVLNRRLALAGLAYAVLAPLSVPALARAVGAAPAWQLRAVASPTVFSAADNPAENGFTGGDEYELLITNVGGAPSDGSPITVTGTPPPGVTFGAPFDSAAPEAWSCVSAGGSSFTCEYPGPEASLEEFPNTVGALGQAAQLTVPLRVDPGVPADTVVTSAFSVAGGGAPSASSGVSTVLNPSAPAPFGVQDAFSYPADAAGTEDERAADRPNSLTIGFDFANAFAPFTAAGGENSHAVEDVRDIVVDLPAGFSGDPRSVPACPIYALIKQAFALHESNCPAASQVGTVDLNVRGNFEQTTAGDFNLAVGSLIPVFNMVPERGHAAELGTSYAGVPVLFYPTVVGSGADAHIRVDVPGIPAAALLGAQGVQLTLFGDPAEQSGGATTAAAFLTNPSWCSGQPLTTTVYGDSYQNRGRRNADGTPDVSDPAWVRASTTTAATTGCDVLHFTPSMSVRPETTQMDAPSGASVEFGFPQNSDPRVRATPALRDATVVLPAGVSVSPGGADGLQACSDAQFEASSNRPATCPSASQVGTVTVTTPILAQPLTGQVFVGSPECSPCSAADAQAGRMVRLFMQVQGPGVVLKFPGVVSVDPGTGRLTATFRDLTQQPVSDILVQFKGGPRAPLATPQACGVATSTSDLTPWSAPETPDASLSSSFAVDWDGSGGACPAGLPFAPGFSGGAVTPFGGGFSAFTVTFSRYDREQNLSAVTVSTPPGLLGVLKGVAQCGEPQAAQGACGPASEIGTTRVAAGAGSHPLWVEGKVYLTGPYRGQPFGLSVVVPAVAGPFNLGTVVVRASIHVDPHTSALTIASDAFPTSIDGVPLRIQTVNVTVDRPEFTFNPTNCGRMEVTGTITSVQDASASVSTPFQVGGCANLPFHPAFTVSSQANTSKKNGASLDVKTSYPAGSANIASVAVTLPRQLPARLTTIQQACPQATFTANPASCPVGSNIGMGTAVTPILAGPLTGPAYLVSHGGAAFPDLVLVLQGEGVTVDLTGSIDIKHSVTSSTFASVPDAPISSFELKLPEGPHSGLTAVVPAKAKGNLCGQALTMPTTITGQNGAVLRQSTRIKVTGCAKRKRQIKRKHRSKSIKHEQGRGN
jgi:hypothetical protein